MVMRLIRGEISSGGPDVFLSASVSGLRLRCRHSDLASVTALVSRLFPLWPLPCCVVVVGATRRCKLRPEFSRRMPAACSPMRNRNGWGTKRELTSGLRCLCNINCRSFLGHAPRQENSNFGHAFHGL